MTDSKSKNQQRKFPIKCITCGKKAVFPAKVTEDREIKHEGQLHTVHVEDLPVTKCTECGEVYYGNDANDQIYSALRRKLGLLTPEEIRSNRDRLQLTQKQLADRLGTADETISRWESGLMIQSRAMDNLLRLYFSVPEARAFLSGANDGGVVFVVSADNCFNQPLTVRIKSPNLYDTRRLENPEVRFLLKA